MVNYIILYKKFVEHHVIKLILLKISKLSARLTQAIIRDKLQRLKHTQDICTRQLITMFKCARALDKSTEYIHTESYLSEKSVRCFFDCVCKWRVHVWPPCS